MLKSLMLDQCCKRGWVMTVYFDCVICSAFSNVLLFRDYVTKSAYHFWVVRYPIYKYWRGFGVTLCCRCPVCVGSSVGVARTLNLLFSCIVPLRAVDECTFLRLEELAFCQPLFGGEEPSSSSLDDDILCTRMCGVSVGICDALFLPVVHGWCCIDNVAAAIWNVGDDRSTGWGDPGDACWPCMWMCIGEHCWSVNVGWSKVELSGG